MQDFWTINCILSWFHNKPTTKVITTSEWSSPDAYFFGSTGWYSMINSKRKVEIPNLHSLRIHDICIYLPIHLVDFLMVNVGKKNIHGYFGIVWGPKSNLKSWSSDASHHATLHAIRLYIYIVEVKYKLPFWWTHELHSWGFWFSSSVWKNWNKLCFDPWESTHSMKFKQNWEQKDMISKKLKQPTIFQLYNCLSLLHPMVKKTHYIL